MISLDNSILQLECDIFHAYTIWHCVDKGFDDILCKHNKILILLVERNTRPCHIFFFVDISGTTFLMFFCEFQDLHSALLSNRSKLTFNFPHIFFYILFFGLFVLVISLFFLNHQGIFYFWYLNIYIAELAQSLLCSAHLIAFLALTEHWSLYIALESIRSMDKHCSKLIVYNFPIIKMY